MAPGLVGQTIERAWNQRCQPLAWTEDADQILSKLKRQDFSNEPTIAMPCRYDKPHERPLGTRNTGADRDRSQRQQQ
jgi:hypothetical protein